MRLSIPGASPRQGRGVRLHVPWPLVALATLGVTLAVVLIVSPAARDGGDRFLSNFRVQKSAPLAIIDAGAPDLPGIDTAAFTSALKVDLPPGVEVATRGDAQDRLDFNVRSLRRQQAPRINVFVGVTATISLDRGALQKALVSAGVPAFSLPRELDTQIQADIPAAVRFVWNDPSGEITLWESRNPKLYTTSGPTWEELRTQLIQAYFVLNPEAARRLMAVRDWDKTVVVPVPPGATTRRVKVDSTEDALLIEQQGRAILIWQRYGVVHLLDAPMSGTAVLRLAENLR